MPTLVELVGTYQQLREAAEDVDSDVFEDTLQSISDDMESRIDGYGAVIAELKAEAGKWKAEEERARKYRTTFENRINRLKQNYQYAMQKMCKRKVEGKLFKARLQRNAPHVVIENEQAIPADYTKAVYQIDKKSLLDALKAGKDVPGARIEQTESIRIK